MPYKQRACPTVGCENVTEGGRCHDCAARSDAQRGTAAQRGYDYQHRTGFAPAVLKRDPRCVCADPRHGHAARCGATSQHADHHPRSRRELVALSLDPNDPKYGRGVCHRCHSKRTAEDQPGGWHHSA